MLRNADFDGFFYNPRKSAFLTGSVLSAFSFSKGQLTILTHEIYNLGNIQIIILTIWNEKVEY